mmetsp:Transcript_1997/g.3520  ORF Transcript_1997/g.3520 Transcript_1997/m.3520 type:complete len:312 (-) Transcript_1997:185-1120(-)|eukprot:CAMPEP_0203749380 /NCGR_PEP_ID=MMETSP0098-20131031/3970_1 /ASSEMBLY_ACC=CAM_ASM_000208 /TAXON_ID=96639 /ORGANISM=" , Strain NY0313808BC1" /LENGTH=311 /DNA_ID=CAMNT_0050638433 /DNA_START=2500 /DNA_END=3435 /DNA_ORIENTATION=+
MAAATKNVLVVGATGRIGSEVCKSLLRTAGTNVFGTTRSVPSKKLAGMGVKPVKFAFGDKESAVQAIKTSKASSVFFVTDYFVAAKKSGKVEIEQGCTLVDACKECNVDHVVFSSVADCDKVPENVDHFRTKYDIEEYLKASGLSYSILRPVAFFENLHDPANHNPLKKGSVKGLWDSNLKLKMVSCHDIGRAAAIMLQNPGEWNGKTLDCASCEVDGKELAAGLTEASGVPCTYKKAIPSFIQWVIMRGHYHMVKYFENPGYSSSVEAFRAVVPDAFGPKEFFTYLGQWGNGEKFTPSKSDVATKETPAP